MKSILNQKVLLLCLFILFFAGSLRMGQVTKSPFQAENAFRMLTKLQANGPRVPGTASHEIAVEYISNQLKSNGWQVRIQSGSLLDHPVHNIFATRDSGSISTILASHYDSRMFADKEPNSSLRVFPVPGANDGGSSTVVLLELSRILDPANSSDIAFVFFDSEDQGNISGWDWILGSRLFVKQMKKTPSKMILLDMVGGFDQKIIPPVNSDTDIYKEIRVIAKDLGYSENFLLPANHAILDDHVPFLEAGVPAVDLIDIIDSRWHTTSDDLENVSMQSLQRVGDTLYFWILAQEKPGNY
jgi:glutaminyl-peptide cyclotransferase